MMRYTNYFTCTINRFDTTSIRVAHLARLRYDLDTTWILLVLGYNLDTTWILLVLGYNLDTTWILLGYNLDTTWIQPDTTWILLRSVSRIPLFFDECNHGFELERKRRRVVVRGVNRPVDTTAVTARRRTPSTVSRVRLSTLSRPSWRTTSSNARAVVASWTTSASVWKESFENTSPFDPTPL